MLLFLVAEATADAGEVARRIRWSTKNPIERALITALRALAQGHLESIVGSAPLNAAAGAGVKTLVFFQTIKNAASAASKVADRLGACTITLTEEEAAWSEVAAQFRYAVGAQYQWNERVNVGGAFEYIDLGDARINDPTILTGEYKDNRILMFALNFSYKF